MEFCVYMYLDNRKNPIEFQGHMLKVKVTGPNILTHCHLRKDHAANSCWRADSYWPRLT